eukprot:6210023-Pleurochrysis_carterae.AAC.3
MKTATKLTMKESTRHMGIELPLLSGLIGLHFDLEYTSHDQARPATQSWRALPSEASVSYEGTRDGVPYLLTGSGGWMCPHLHARPRREPASGLRFHAGLPNFRPSRKYANTHVHAHKHTC